MTVTTDGAMPHAPRNPWYERDPRRFQAEKDAMGMVDPCAKLSSLDDGRLCWDVRQEVASPASPGGRREWELRIVYDETRPEAPVMTLCHPVSPSEDELLAILRMAGRDVPHIPCTIHDEDGLVLSTSYLGQPPALAGVRQATAELKGALRWIRYFEMSLVDDQAWRMFQHG